MQANKNGFFYVLDRTNGKFISASPFAQVNWATAIDPKTGRPLIRPEAHYTKEQAIQIFPGPGGAHNWAPMAFNPTTNLMYIPISANSSSSYRLPDTYAYTPGRTNMGVTFGGGFGGPPAGGARGAGGAAAAPGAATGGIAEPGAAAGAGFAVPVAAPATAGPALPSVGPVDKDGKFQTGNWLVAIDPSTQKEKWRVQGGGSIGGGALTTAGNLVFQVQNNGHLLAYRADTGDKLLDVATNQTGNMGPPITFMIDNKQYIAVAGGAGPRGGGGGQRGPAAGAPPLPAAPAAPAPPPVYPRLYAYVLDGKAENPTPTPPPAPAGGFPGGFGPPPAAGPGAPALPTAPAAGRGGRGQ
jgi:alcohol dehydrogenase (cytochrome c)/quinohemoprotein ethanol dehydrogenase